MKIQDKSYVLNFTGGHLEVPINDVFNLTQKITIGAWIKPTSGTGLQATILSKGYKIFEPQVQNNKLVFERGPEYASASNIAMNEWVYITITFDSTIASDNLTFYINGKLDKVYTINTPLENANNPIWIGARSQSSLPYSGEMAGVAIWNSARTSWQILQDFNNIDITSPDLVAYWSMDDGTGALIKDEGKHTLNATITGAVTWQTLSTPIALHNTPQKKRLRNTTIQRIDELEKAPNDSHEEDHIPLPSSGRNGEATKFLNRVREYKTVQVSNAQIKNNQALQTAKQANASKLQRAHIEAAKKMNSTRFDAIWFIYQGRIHQVNPQGTLSEYYVGNVSTSTKAVPANQVWFDTGITLAAGETVKIKYTGGRWNVSPAAANLTAQGSSRYIAKPGYALAGKPEGSLIGKVGNGNAFYVGNNFEVPVGQTGKLFLTANDDQRGEFGAGYRDNSGSINVNISLVKQAISVQASDLMVDQAKNLVFWSQATIPFTLHVANIDGSGHKTLVSHPDNPITSVALDELNQYVYHIVGTGRIMRVKYDGSDHKTLLDISGPAKEHYWQIEIDAKNKKMYWTNDYSIWRANLDGSESELVISNHDAPFPIDIAIDSENNKLYWVDKELEVVRRSDLNGNNPEDLFTAINPIRGLMLDYVTPEMKDQLKQEVYWVAREESITAQTPGITGHWLMDEGTGDAIHNNIDPFHQAPLGLLKNNTDLPPNMLSSDYALSFTGIDQAQISDDYIEDIYGNSFTICLWIKPNVVPANEDAGLVAGTSFTTNKSLHLVLRHGKPYLGFYNNDLSGKTTIEPNKWVHLAFSYDVAKKEQSIFINGVLDASSGNHAPLEKVPNASTLVGTYSTSHFDGLITDIRVNNQALSSQAIAKIMSAPNADNLMKHVISAPIWNIEDTPPTLVAKPAVLTFNGVSTYTHIGNAVDLHLYNSNFTVECWINIKQASSGDLTILGTEISKQSEGLHLIIRNNKPYMGFYGDNLGSSTTITAGEWHHIAWRFDASTRQQTLFIDGINNCHRQSSANFLGQGAVHIGRCIGGRIFNGNLSDLKLWNTARSDHEIATNYRHYRVSFALRGAVDGSSQPEHLFDIPAEGGLNLTSQFKKEFEQRVLAFRKRKENQKIAAKQVSAAHDEKSAKIVIKTKKLQETQTQTAASINTKKAEHTQDRSANRSTLVQAQNNKADRIKGAQTAAQTKKSNANSEAARIKGKANSEANQLKAAANANRNRARAARDKNR
jgi:hypothetical protein